MERIPVHSTTISAIAYDVDTQELEVEFMNGSVYRYSGVPSEEHEGLMSAGSKGKYLHASIKSRYPFVKI